MEQLAPKTNPLGHAFHPSILREYDIRGIVGDTLHKQDAYILGKAFGSFVARQGGQKICVGYDGRNSSPALAKALIKGLLETGLHIENIGIGPTPMLYFSVKDRLADAGIMITGSHNPASYNGFKMTLQNAPVYGDTIQEIGNIAANGDFYRQNQTNTTSNLDGATEDNTEDNEDNLEGALEGSSEDNLESNQDGITQKGSVQDIDVKNAYVERLLKDFEGGRALNIAWDAGHGAAGEILQLLTQKLPGKHYLLYEDIDGDFPAHHPDPTVDKNLEDLKKLVSEQNCDLGIAFDGDGDRIGVVDEKGTILRCDILMILYAKAILEEMPGSAIIGDVKCSQIMFDQIQAHGGNAVMWKTGHSLVKAKMAELKSPLAGELSGHIFFADKYYGFDDALYCAIRLINIIAEEDNPLSAHIKDFPKLISTPEIRIEVDEEEKFGIVPKVVLHLKSEIEEGIYSAEFGEIGLDDIDGIRVNTKLGWWILRASNTQNALVARIEAIDENGLKQLHSMLKEKLSALGYDFDFNVL